jgi:beta-galactosidase
VARVVDRNQRLFLDARPPQAEVAVIYNPLSHFIGGRQRGAATGGPQGEVAGIERDSLLGVYRALFGRNVPLDYVHIQELSEEVLKPYKLVILPYPLMLPEASAAPLKRYVENGGALVAEARLGWSNERGYASDRIPGMGLWEVMGCRETAVQVAARGRANLRWTGNAIPGMKADDLLPGRWYQETLEPLAKEARVVAQFADGAAGAVVSRYGRGKTLMLGTYLSAAYESSPSAATQRFYAGLLDWAGIAAPVSSAGENIEVRLLEAPEATLAFLFNHGKQAAETNTVLRLDGQWRATDLISGQAVPLANESGQVRLNRRLDPSDVWVVRLARP